MFHLVHIWVPRARSAPDVAGERDCPALSDGAMGGPRTTEGREDEDFRAIFAHGERDPGIGRKGTSRSSIIIRSFGLKTAYTLARPDMHPMSRADR